MKGKSRRQFLEQNLAERKGASENQWQISVGLSIQQETQGPVDTAGRGHLLGVSVILLFHSHPQ